MAVDGGVLSFVDLFFHSPDAPRMPKRPDAPATADPAWRDTYAERGWAVTALDPAAVVIDHIAFITSPPDGRYSPLGTPQQAAGGAAAARLLQQEQQQGGAAGGGDAEREEARRGLVRALVLPLDAAAGAAEGLQVELVGHLPDGPQLFAKPMQLQPGASSSGGSSGSGGGGLLYAAQAETTISCVGAAGGPAAHCHAPSELVMLQVRRGAAWWGCGRVGAWHQAVFLWLQRCSEPRRLRLSLATRHSAFFPLPYCPGPTGQRAGRGRQHEPLAAPARRAALRAAYGGAPGVLGGACGGAAAAGRHLP